MKLLNKISTNNRDLVRKILIITSLLSSLLTTPFFIDVYKTELSYEISLIKNNQSNSIKLASSSISSLFQEIQGDLQVLVNFPEFNDIIKKNDSYNEEALLHIAEHFINVSNAYERYDQIRFIDERGMEVIRVDFDKTTKSAFNVPKFKLQDKSDRYYFYDVFALDRNSFYFSPLDLNIERGEVEIPFKPVIRMAMPLYIKGEKKGIVIVNLLGDRLLQRLPNFFSEDESPYLLNKDGYLLYGENSDELWGFMFPEKNQLTFQNLFPDVWKEIFSLSHGSLTTQKGIFSWKELDINEIFKRDNAPNTDISIYPKDYSWRLLSYFPREKIIGNILKHTIFHFLSLIFVLSLINFFLYLLWKYQLKVIEKTNLDKLVLERLENISKASNSILWETDNNGYFTYFKDYSNTLTNLKSEDILGKIRIIDLHPSYDENIFKAILSRRKNNTVFFPILSNKSDLKWYKSTSSPIIDEYGTVVGFRGVLTDINELKIAQNQLLKERDIITELNETLKTKSFTDELTNLGNRRHFFENILPKLSDRVFSLAIVDFDNFKAINDNFGHERGDEILIGFSNILREKLENVSDFAFRWGGDEFLIIFEDLHKEEVDSALEEISKTFEREFLPITLSYGVEESNTNDTSIRELISSADHNMYQNKKLKKLIFNSR